MRKLFLSILSIIIISSFCVATGFQNVNAANNEWIVKLNKILLKK